MQTNSEVSKWRLTPCGMSDMQYRNSKCVVCGESVEKVSKALCQKLFDRKTKKILCLQCLSNELEVDESELLEKAEEFKSEGCPLFK